MTPAGVAQAVSIGTGAAYDPGAVRGWLRDNAGQSSGGGGTDYTDGVITGSNGHNPAFIGGGGGANLGFGGGSSGGGSQAYGASSGPQMNPYLDQMAQSITNQMNDNYTRNIAPAARSGAMAAGGFGGSRQGVVDANGMKDMNQALGNSLANLYGTGWQNSQQNWLQQQGVDNQRQSLNNQYDLGLRSSDLGFAGLDANIANSNFTNQLNAANFGLNATNAMNGQTGAGIQAGNDIQNMPIRYWQQFANNANATGGGGGTTTGTFQGATDPLSTAFGGAAMGYDMYRRANLQPAAPTSQFSGMDSGAYRPSDPRFYGD
jgi:hypothetical protein